MPNNIPQNLQAERAVIGACLLSSDALGTVSEILKPEDFSDINSRTANVSVGSGKPGKI